MMCAEKDPMNCHRNLLVAKQLDTYSIDIRHILADGSIKHHSELNSDDTILTGDLFEGSE